MSSLLWIYLNSHVFVYIDTHTCTHASTYLSLLCCLKYPVGISSECMWDKAGA